MLGKLVARLAASLLLVTLLVAVLAVFTELRPVHPAAVLLAVTAITAVFAALGVALASRLRRLDSFRLYAALVTVPLYLFSGIFYPVSTLPAPMRVLAYANPLTYGADLFRFGLLDVHEIAIATDVAMLSGLACGATLLAIGAFARVRT